MPGVKKPAAGRITAGFHISIAGGLEKVAPRAVERGCTTFQFFTSSPSQWSRKPVVPADAAAFMDAAGKAGFKVYFVHAIYLLNPASADRELREKSSSGLADELSRAQALGASGVIFHLGSVGAGGDAEAGLARVAVTLEEARKASGSKVPLVLENSAGAGGTLGASPGQLETIIKLAPEAEPMAICIDTAHAFAAGIPINTKEGVDELMGLPFLRSRLGVLHINDSLGGLGSHRDRHWHLGRGELGSGALRTIVNHPAVRDLPLIMETPGTVEDDRLNMKTLKKLLK